MNGTNHENLLSDFEMHVRFNAIRTLYDEYSNFFDVTVINDDSERNEKKSMNTEHCVWV